MPDLSSVDVDEVLISLKRVGKYQIIQAILFLVTYLTEAYHSLSIVFIGKDNPYTCAPPPDQTVNQTGDVYGECSITSHNDTNTTTCIHGYSYLYPKAMSIKSDFDLVCDQRALSDFSQTLLNLGMAVGSYFLTLASDKFGRKPICVLSHLGCLVTGVAATFAPNYIAFIILKLLNGAALQGTVLSAFTYVVETFPKEQRRLCSIMSSVIWTICMCSMSPVAYLVRMFSWRVVQLTFTSVSLFALIQYWVTDESIRWLVANNRLEDVVRIVKKAAHINKVDVNKPLKLLCDLELRETEAEKLTTAPSVISPDAEIEKLPKILDSETTEDKGETTEDKGETTKDKGETAKAEKYTILIMFKKNRHAITILIIWYLWFTNSLIYSGIMLTSSSLAGNMYVNFFLNALVEAPSAVVFWYTLDRFGRRKTSMVFFAIASFGLIMATVLRLYDDDGTTAIIATVFSFVGKFGISVSGGIIWLWIPELFPTNIRNVAFGSANAVCRLGGMISPFCSLLASKIPWAPGAIFGVFSVIGTGLLWFLPETMGKELPQTMEDMDRLYDDKKKPDVSLNH